jgi:hypothetical protein
MQIEKLSRDEFDAALRRGLGRALLHVRHYGDTGVEDLIEDALVFDYSYDMQLEGSRSDWLLDILRHVGDIKTYVKHLLQRYAEGEDLDRNLIQQIEISSKLFDQGFEQFRPIVISKYKRLKLLESTRPSRAAEVIYCCGLPGFALAASLEGPKDAEANKYWTTEVNCADILDSAENFLGDRSVKEFLDEWSNKNNTIKSFKEAAAGHNQGLANIDSQASDPVGIDELITSIELLDKQSRRHAIKFRKSASDDELRKLYANLIRCNDAEKQLNYLAIFTSRPFPEIGSEIIALLDSSNAQVRRATAKALSLITSPVVRKLAIELLVSEEDELREYAFKLLTNNYEMGDHVCLEVALRRFSDDNHLHWAGMSLKTIAKNSDDAALSSAILFLFANGPDPFCRDDFLEILLNWQKCPEAILYEAQWDFYWEVQALARGKLSQSIKDLRVEGLELKM